MILLVHTEPVFAELILRTIPTLSRIAGIGAAMKKYTSGYLTEKRLYDAVKAGTLPMATLTEPPRPGDPPEKVHENQALGHYVPGSDVISLKGALFRTYKEGHPGSRVLAPVTLFHELAHWGNDMAKREGHPADSFGDKHQRHGLDLSPLDVDVERAMRDSWPSLPGGGD